MNFIPLIKINLQNWLAITKDLQEVQTNQNGMVYTHYAAINQNNQISLPIPHTHLNLNQSKWNGYEL
jgi:hypothetical protein